MPAVKAAPTTPTVYGYARASTTEQQETLTVQADVTEREYKHRFPTLAWGGVIADKGVSGSVPFSQRPEGGALSTRLNKGDVVIVTKLDRGFRNLKDLCDTLERWDKRGVRLVLLDIQMDTGTAVGRMVVHIMGAVAEFDRKRIGERTNDVVNALAAKRGWRSKPPYGFKILKQHGKKIMVPDPYTRLLGAAVVKWIDAGWTHNDVWLHFLGKKVKNRLGYEIGHASIRTFDREERKLQAVEKLAAEKGMKNLGDGHKDITVTQATVPTESKSTVPQVAGNASPFDTPVITG